MDNFRFWNQDLFDEAYSETYTDSGTAAWKSLTKAAIQYDKVVYQASAGGTPLVTQDKVTNFILANGGRLISFQRGYEQDDFKFDNLKFVWEDGFISLDTYSNKTLNVNIYSLNEDLVKRVEEFFKKSLTTESSGKVYTFVTENNTLKLSRMAKVTGVPLVRQNYGANVLEDYDHIVTDVVSSDPCGKLSILDGPPGTGKTHLVRGLINDVKEALWVLIPADMITSLTKPDFIPVLSSTKSAWKKELPFIFVLEDADSCLVPRAADNMSSISNVLNFADGIFGNLFDIRIIATTNAKVIDIDPAVMRAGRLCKRVEVGVLNNKEANLALDTILKDYAHSYAPLEEKAYTLADVYQIARKIKNKLNTEVRSSVVDVPKKRFGF